ncbi:uncharacterized protein LOC102700393 [Oryza brachyantha]|uniref:uncharacterized protein LOC102700393 n=1 Tax=Oryza brachyantha TaxID=4533 RepID=UPI000776519E|nr:uncharacterized protein LOC102700393 [Oryza brachyantha]
MRARFVPSYYARDMLNKLQQLAHGGTSVEEYYQALQMGMLRCGLVEDEEAAMARFLGGLDQEIYDILSYKEYNNMTRLFHYACKAERKVQGRHARTKANTPAGRTPWTARSGTAPGGRSSTLTSTLAPSTSNKTRPSPSTTSSRAAEAVEKTAKPTSSVASTGRTRDVQCDRCPSKHVLIVKNVGEYSSASDFDEDKLALLTANNTRSKDDEHIRADVANKYESLIVQSVLSAQMGKSEQNQRHNLFQMKCVVNKRSCRTIIDRGSCRNLVSTEMVTELALQTKPHPHSYYIQWFNDSGRIKADPTCHR